MTLFPSLSLSLPRLQLPLPPPFTRLSTLLTTQSALPFFLPPDPLSLSTPATPAMYRKWSKNSRPLSNKRFLSKERPLYNVIVLDAN